MILNSLGVMSDVQDDPMIEILAGVLVNMEGLRRPGDVARVLDLCVSGVDDGFGVDAAVGGRLTDVMIICGTRWTLCSFWMAWASEE